MEINAITVNKIRKDKKMSKAVLNERMTQTIGNLPDGSKTVYLRPAADNKPFLKLNERFHVQVRHEGTSWIGDGCAEEFNPNEEVIIVQ